MTLRTVAECMTLGYLVLIQNAGKCVYLSFLQIRLVPDDFHLCIFIIYFILLFILF